MHGTTAFPDRTETRARSAPLSIALVGRHIGRVAPARVALRDPVRSLTYAELNDLADRLACDLLAFGLAKGDVVAAYLPNCIEYVVVVLAVARAGGIFSPINPRYKSKEVGDILEQGRPVAVFCDAERRPFLDEALARFDGPGPKIVEIDDPAAGAAWLDRLAASAPGRLPEIGPEDDFSLMFTSGTRGRPKGALATHGARIAWVLNAAIVYGLRDDDVYLGIMPQVHSAGLTFTLMHLYVGGTIEILRDFLPAAYLERVERAKVTSSLAVPTMISMIAHEIEHGGRSYDLSSLRRLLSCGAALPGPLKRRAIERITPHLYDYYGSTESNSMTVLTPRDQLRRPTSVGQPFVNVEIMIADAAGRRLPNGAVGEICCKNPSLFSRYVNRPEETRCAFVDGWYRTGDLGHVDDEGYVFISGRATDTIISGGVNVYPAEIEQALLAHPDIWDCAVVGTPDAKWGQAISAYVVRRPGARLGLREVQTHVARGLADFKKPRRLMFLDALPKNAGGKTVKAELPTFADAEEEIAQ